MPMFETPDIHAANPPETWTVAKDGRRWKISAAGIKLDSFSTKTAALAAKETGQWVDLYNKDRRWYAGEKVSGWKPYQAPGACAGEPAPGSVAHAARETDWTAADSVTAFVRLLSDDTRQKLTAALQPDTQALAAEQTASLASMIRDELPDVPGLIGVIFRPGWYDNGYFLTATAGELIYRNGEEVKGDFPDNIEELFTEIYGRVADTAGLAYSSITGQLEYFETYGGVFAKDWLMTQAGVQAG